MTRFGVMLAVLLAADGAGASDLVFSPTQTETCLSASPESEMALCIGASAEACMEATPGGGSTVGMAGCIEAEWQYWDGRLNAVYKRAMAAAKQTDAEMAGLGSAAPKQAPALRDMQRAWIAFRDARCGYEQSLWGGGTGGGPAALGCMMSLTGEQTLFLENRLGAF